MRQEEFPVVGRSSRYSKWQHAKRTESSLRSGKREMHLQGGNACRFSGEAGHLFLFRFGLGIFAAVFLLPVFLLFIYRIESVHPVSTLMIKESIAGPGAEREWVDFENIAPVLYQSVMMSEDGQFCFHNGIDWNALNQVIDDAIEGNEPAGRARLRCSL